MSCSTVMELAFFLDGIKTVSEKMGAIFEKQERALSYAATWAWTLLILLLLSANSPASDLGADLLPVFRDAHQGKPLRCVAVGGSITQAGKGWIGPWLKESFPRSNVIVHNAGMSATGSMLGMFRLERDVISCQPDLVLIEYCVNDGGARDEDVYWTLESIVRKLKALDDPPAVVFVMAASQDKSKIYRHKQVADHYGLLSIDLQKMSDDYLVANNSPWKRLFGDRVHPNKAGHEFYGESIAKVLSPFVEKAKTLEDRVPPQPLPKQLSRKTLILDGRLVPIAIQPGWRKEHTIDAWWNMFFNGVVATRQPGSTMVIPFKATIAGLMFPLSKTYGLFVANVDGHGVEEIVCNHRGGYEYVILGKDLTPEEHVINIALPDNSDQGEGVKLGYLLLGGTEHVKPTLARQGGMGVDKLREFSCKRIPISQWYWVGPFGQLDKPWSEEVAMKNLDTVFEPEKEYLNKTASEEDEAVGNSWKLAGNGLVDFSQQTTFKDRGICYTRATVDMEEAGPRKFALRIDYWGKIWINNQLVKVVRGHHQSPHKTIHFEADLKEGDNDIFIKVCSGSGGHFVELELVD